MARASVVFVDDDKFYAMRWIEKLRERFTVHHFTDAEDARGFLLTEPKIRGVVLDVMMPVPATASAEETARGLETGLWLLGEIQDHIRSFMIPVIVLTNRESTRITERVGEFGFPTGLIEVRRKLETDRHRLLEIVHDKVTRWHGDSDQ